MFVLMGAVNILLFWVMRKKQETISNGYFMNQFEKESRTLIITLTFFELSYLTRFIWDNFLVYDFADKLEYELFLDLFAYIDIVPFIFLLMIHR